MDWPYICVFDIEHDSGKIFQFSGIMYKRVGEGLYQLCRNINMYANIEVSRFITKLTGITQNFLNHYGANAADFVGGFKNFIGDISLEEILFVSHGAQQDMLLLFENGFPLEGSHYACTYSLAKKVLKRGEHLTLRDVAEESGYVFPAHNAYPDALATASVLSFLLKKKGEKNYE